MPDRPVNGAGTTLCIFCRSLRRVRTGLWTGTTAASRPSTKLPKPGGFASRLDLAKSDDKRDTGHFRRIDKTKKLPRHNTAVFRPYRSFLPHVRLNEIR